MRRDKSYTDRLIEHCNNLLDLFPHCRETDPVKLYRALRRLEKQGELIAVKYCNGEIQSDAYEKSSDRLEAKVLDLLGAAAESSAAVPVFINGDPRGYALKIRDEWMRENASDSRLHRDWGGYGIIAPDFDED